MFCGRIIISKLLQKGICMNTDEYFAMGFAKTAKLKGYNAAELAKRREALNKSLNNLKEFSEWADRQPSAKITGTPDAIAAAKSEETIGDVNLRAAYARKGFSSDVIDQIMKSDKSQRAEAMTKAMRLRGAANENNASNTNMVNMVNRMPPRTPYLKTMQIKGMRSQMAPSPRTGVPTSSWDETYKKMKEFNDWMRKQPAANIRPIKHNF